MKKILRFLKRNPFKILFAIFFCSLSSYVVMGTLMDDSTRAQEKVFDPNIKGDKPLAVDVDVVLVKKQEVQTTKELPGRVVALNSSEVRSQVDGVITNVLFEEGSYVEKGQQLYQIDPDLYQARFSKVKANYHFLRKKKYRYSKLLKIGAVSRQEFEEVNSAYVGAREDLRQAEIDLEYSKVYAPISGHIGVSYFTKGALTKKDENAVLAIINQIDSVFVDVRYPASEFGIIRQHLNCNVSIETSDGKVLEGGVIDSFEREIDQSSDSFLVRVRIDNKDLELAPGMYVGVSFSLESTQGITVPIKTTYRDVDGSLFVWHVNAQHIVSKRNIVANSIFQNSWVVESGLKENETIVYEGVQKIYEGALINPNIAQGVK
ncbi:MAG: efflux RND transporter periplasmic adaptor subunit [Rickettsiales bacterium]|nr:efflux RND transporter periplasmic adaptor subunit [Rickettsiales bacterium]